MTDFEKCELAFDILEYAEVVEPDGGKVVLKVDAKMWNKFLGIGNDDEIHSGQDSQDRQDR